MRPDWGGALILVCGLGARGAAVSLAANIAGAACLAIDERADVCRAALRSGACDFVVNTVDEALRVLKNQIRQRKPVSVGLTLAFTPALVELLDRGVLPQLFTDVGSDVKPAGASGLDPATRDRAIRTFSALGTLIVDFDPSSPASSGGVDARQRLEFFTREHNLQLESFVFPSADELRAFDARLLQIIPATDLRHRWCSAAPRFFHRERPYRRTVFLASEEIERASAAS